MHQGPSPSNNSDAPPDLVADLLLRFYRNPVRYRDEMQQLERIAGDVGVVLRLAAGKPVELTDPALTSGDPAALRKELAAAAAFHVQQVFFRSGATHYQVLGLRRDASHARVRDHFRLLMQLVHPDRLSAKAEWPESFAARVNAAYAVLRNEDKRKTYDAQLGPAVARTRALAPRQPSTRAKAPPPTQLWWHGGADLVRKHPAITAFTGLFVMSATLLGAVAVANHDAPLSRDAMRANPVNAPTPVITTAVAPAAFTPPQPPSAPMAPQAEPTSAALAAASLYAAPAGSRPATSNELDALFATFVTAYEAGQLEQLLAIFDENAEKNASHGRAAIRKDYDDLFRMSTWRRMLINEMRLTRLGDRTRANVDLTVRVAWRDGREAEERMNIDVDVVAREGRLLIGRFSNRLR